MERIYCLGRTQKRKREGDQGAIIFLRKLKRFERTRKRTTEIRENRALRNLFRAGDTLFRVDIG